MFTFFKPHYKSTGRSLQHTDTFSDGDSAASTSADSNEGFSRAKFDGHSYRQLRLIKPKETLEELLERLLRKAEHTSGNAQANFLQQMLLFLSQNPGLVNKAPKNFHSNPLELAIQIGDLKVAAQLLLLKATVRPENRHMLRKIEHR
jgi:hypothetical protein